ncbi:metal ABC transporter substrate-binding protein [Halovivax limisalsi]|uniref:metal ABC transporter substrate-binding protein n=1 Tax=Halovivax limisalsi TaxID=1453760 RepID=UPI001FFCE8B6|nr:metal ABC transporter substrate-binding protein [Halovivax limisalsi]
MPRITRRRFTAGALGATLGAVSGCLDAATSDDSDDGRSTARASFFVFGDFASEVAGDVSTASTLVPVGQHGHGWEPGPRIQAEVLDSDLFIYGMDGFQPWADALVASLRADDADVDIVPAGAGVEPVDREAGHEDGDGSHDHDGHDGDGAHEEDDGDHDHDHGGRTDPHFWLDPLQAKQAVETIRRGFVAVDEANEATYAETAASYGSRLDELDRAFESVVSDASNDVVLVAGHDAFGHLARRYGFEVRTLTGLSPDARPTPRDVERARKIVDEHDLRYVCADPLESQRAATQIVEETDAIEVLPLTPIPGQTEAWADDGWGYVEIMDRVNLETLETALDA